MPLSVYLQVPARDIAVKGVRVKIPAYFYSDPFYPIIKVLQDNDELRLQVKIRKPQAA